jgi:hypothetical protein
MDGMLNQFLRGVLAMGCWAIGLTFLRFWMPTRDRLFLFFCLAFWVLSLNWIGLAIVNPGDETRHYFYFVRLVAFVLIIAAIIDKNRRGPA